jgi:hypothetical protein
VLVKLAGPIATVITGGLLYNQNSHNRKGIQEKMDAGFQAVNKRIDETKKGIDETKDPIKGNDKEYKDRPQEKTKSAPCQKMFLKQNLKQVLEEP